MTMVGRLENLVITKCGQRRIYGGDDVECSLILYGWQGGGKSRGVAILRSEKTSFHKIENFFRKNKKEMKFFSF